MAVLSKDRMCTSKCGSILEELEKVVLEDRGYTPYFSGHKARYKSDLQVIDNHYLKNLKRQVT